jgi:2-iminobutanoate/2-iminopropanoate deaminase
LPAKFEAECRNVFESMKSKVEAAGSTMARVLKCTCFLTDVGDFKKMNALFGEYFPEQPPARSTVVIKALVVEGARVEIDCIAAL